MYTARPLARRLYNAHPVMVGGEFELDVSQQVIETIVRVLDLRDGAQGMSRATPLLGHVPELDSMAVATLIGSLEERFGFVVEDDEIDGSTFATVGSLVSFVESKLAA